MAVTIHGDAYDNALAHPRKNIAHCIFINAAFFFSRSEEYFMKV